MRKLLSVIFLSALILGTAGVETFASAHDYKLGDIKIGHIWARATPPGAGAAAVYVPLLNEGKDADRLSSVSTPVAAKASIHGHVMEDNMTKMPMMDGIDLEPGKPVALSPNGMHIMLIGLKQPLKDGDKFPLTLHFDKAGDIEVQVMVSAIGAQH
jgi:copper(I)-binding protein